MIFAFYVYYYLCYLLGEYHVGDEQAHSWMLAGTSTGGSIPNLAVS